MNLVLAAVPGKEPWEDHPQGIGEILAASCIAKVREYVEKNGIDKKFQSILAKALLRKAFERELESGKITVHLRESQTDSLYNQALKDLLQTMRRMERKKRKCKRNIGRVKKIRVIRVIFRFN